MARASSTREPKLQPFTFSASISRLLRPISKGMKRLGKLKVSPRVYGKIMEMPSGGRLLIVEKNGRDIWRGRHKSVADAIEAGVAAIGVDRILLQRARDKHGVTHVLVVIEELRRVFGAKIDLFFDQEKSHTHTNWDSRAHRLLGYQHFKQVYFGPSLHKKRKRASA